MAATLAALLASKPVEVETTRGPVLVRGLTRAEMVRLGQFEDDDYAAHVLASGLVEPKAAPKQAKALVAALPAGDYQKIEYAIMHASGMTIKAQEQTEADLGEAT